MTSIYIKPRCGFVKGEEKLHKTVNVEWSYEVIPHLADIDHKRYRVEVVADDGDYDFQPYCDEWCACCDSEVVIPSFGVSFCPNCGELILPCSMCDADYNDCRNCPYEKWVR